MSLVGTMGEENDPQKEKADSLSSIPNPNHQQALRDCVKKAVNDYFHDLDGQEVSNVYDMVLNEMEVPLLEVVMEYVQQNQSRASSILGLNRSTLRKKLKKYGL